MFFFNRSKCGDLSDTYPAKINLNTDPWRGAWGTLFFFLLQIIPYFLSLKMVQPRPQGEKRPGEEVENGGSFILNTRECQ